MKHIIFKSHTLSNQYVLNCTELPLLIKTWPYVFEEYFGYNNQLFIFKSQWDSLPTSKINELKKGLRMNWTLCFEEGKKALNWSYKNAENLLSQFSKYQK